MVIGWQVDIDKGKFFDRKSNLKGRSKSPFQSTRRCWSSKFGNYKRDWKSKVIAIILGYNEK